MLDSHVDGHDHKRKDRDKKQGGKVNPKKNQRIEDLQENLHSLSNLKQKGVNISKGNDNQLAYRLNFSMTAKTKYCDNIIKNPSDPAPVQILSFTHST